MHNSQLFSNQPKSAVEAIESLLVCAIYHRASDIHCDPREFDIFVRFRIDGQIVVAGSLPLVIQDEFIARLKILSGQRTDLHIVPQDGRWRARISGSYYNIRISFMPTYFGENAVMRILPTKVTSEVSLSKLGFRPEHSKIIQDALSMRNGLVLVTGPTGSGKTTTLHTFLSLKAKEPLSIITLEDPVEYEIGGIRQIHIHQNFGVTFASGLRSALRQDPDIIMVGEIRDNETANVAIHTALTGHLVFSTLHTNSALETIPRLVDMGIDNYLLASTLKLIIAQRLVRTMCQTCEAETCEECNFTGYVGRSVIAEIIYVDDSLAKLISRGESISNIRDSIYQQGFRPMIDDGLEKVDWGVTTLQEVMGVLYT